MKSSPLHKLFVTLTLTLFSFQAFAQQYQLSQQGLELKVTGTSTLHDWEMVSAQATGTADIAINSAPSIDNLAVSLQATTLKSGKKGMDDNAYKALKTKDFPTISFKLNKIETNGDKMTATGSLSLAGESRTVTFTGNYTTSGNQLTFTGSTKFKLTDFKIDPPTALMGTIKTGDDVGIEVKSTFIKK